MMCWMSISK